MAFKDWIPKIEKYESIEEKFERHLETNCKDENKVTVIFSPFKENTIKISFNSENKNLAVWPLNFESCAALYTKLQEAGTKQEQGLLTVAKNRVLFVDLMENGGEIRIELNNLRSKSDIGNFDIVKIEENLREKKDKLVIR